jgi:hypothetical protein
VWLARKRAAHPYFARFSGVLKLLFVFLFEE